MSEKKTLPFYVLEVLRNHSSTNSRLSQSEIASYLESDHGCSCDRRTVSAALDTLCKLGYQIKYETSARGGGEYKTDFYLERSLSETESASLLLSIETSTVISRELCELLKEKLKAYLPALESNCETVIQNRDTLGCMKNIWSLDVINKALKDRLMLSFSLISYTSDGHNHFDEELGRVKEYLVKPIGTIYTENGFHLFGELADTKIYRYFPINSIYELKVTNVSFVPIPDLKPPIPKNRLEAATMYFGEREKATLTVDKSLLGEIFSLLSPLCNLRCSYGDKAELEVYADLTLLRRLVLSYGSRIEVLTPTKLRRAVALELQAASAKYREIRKLRGSF